MNLFLGQAGQDLIVQQVILLPDKNQRPKPDLSE